MQKIDWKTYTRNAAVLILTIGIIGSFIGFAHADIVDRILVVVNDDIILLSEIDQIMSSIKKSYESRGVPLVEQERLLRGQRANVLERLIRDKLTDQQVARHKLKVTDDEVDRTIKRIRETNKLSEDEFRRAVELEGLQFDTYRKRIKDQILRTRLVNREVKSRIVVTDSDIKHYYDEHIEQYTGSTKYKLRHILLKLSPDAPDSQVSRVSEEMNMIRRRLQAGESFKDLAMQFSDASTAATGGELGVFGLNLLSEEINAALKGLQPKEFSPVVETDQGQQIFYVEEILQSGGKTLEEAAPEIKEKLYAERVNQKFKTWLEDLRKRSHIQILE